RTDVVETPPEDCVGQRAEVAAATPWNSETTDHETGDRDLVEPERQLGDGLAAHDAAQPAVAIVRCGGHIGGVVDIPGLLEYRDRPVVDGEARSAISEPRSPHQVFEHSLRAVDVGFQRVVGQRRKELVVVAVRRYL